MSEPNGRHEDHRIEYVRRLAELAQKKRFENLRQHGPKNFGVKMLMLQVFLITLAVLFFLLLYTIHEKTAG